MSGRAEIKEDLHLGCYSASLLPGGSQFRDVITHTGRLKDQFVIEAFQITGTGKDCHAETGPFLRIGDRIPVACRYDRAGCSEHMDQRPVGDSDSDHTDMFTAYHFIKTFDRSHIFAFFLHVSYVIIAVSDEFRKPDSCIFSRYMIK